MSVFMHPIFIGLAERRIKVKIVLKNDITIIGRIVAVDANLNLQLLDAASDSPYFPGMTKCFIRGSSVKFVTMNKEDCSFELLDQLVTKEGQLV